MGTPDCPHQHGMCQCKNSVEDDDGEANDPNPGPNEQGPVLQKAARGEPEPDPPNGFRELSVRGSERPSVPDPRVENT